MERCAIRSGPVPERYWVKRRRLPKSMARLAQSAERKALNLVVVGSSPTVGVFCVGPFYQTWPWDLKDAFLLFFYTRCTSLPVCSDTLFERPWAGARGAERERKELGGMADPRHSA